MYLNYGQTYLSVMKLLKRGLKVNFMDYEVKICKENNEIITVGKQFENHFIMCMIPNNKKRYF